MAFPMPLHIFPKDFSTASISIFAKSIYPTIQILRLIIKEQSPDENLEREDRRILESPLLALILFL